MGKRSVDIEIVPGFHELLHEKFLRTAESRMVTPSGDLQAIIEQAGQVFITAASRQPEYEGKVVYCACQWPENGPIHLGIIWARNPFREVDSETGRPFLMCHFSETQDDLLSFDEAQEQLGRYATSHLGKPTLVR